MYKFDKNAIKFKLSTTDKRDSKKVTGATLITDVFNFVHNFVSCHSSTVTGELCTNLCRYIALCNNILVYKPETAMMTQATRDFIHASDLLIDILFIPIHHLKEFFASVFQHPLSELLSKEE